MDLGERIRRFRGSRSRREIAATLLASQGISHAPTEGTLANWEMGRTDPKWYQIVPLAEALGVDILDLLLPGPRATALDDPSPQ